MAITLIPYSNSILLQISDARFLRHDYATWDYFYIDRELDDNIWFVDHYTNTIQRLYFQVNFDINQHPTDFRIDSETILNVYLYPCKPDTEYSIYRVNRGGGTSLVGTVRTLPQITAYKDEWSVSSELSFQDATYNTELVRDYLSTTGWSEEAIAGVLGTMYCRSGINPANIGYLFTSPYSVDSRYLITATRTTPITTIPQGTYSLPYQNEINPSLIEPYWLYGERPIQGSPYWDYTDKGRGGAFGYSGRGFGLLGLRADMNLLYPQSEILIFPSHNFWSGESQVQYLDFESRFNYYWEYDIANDRSQLAEQFKNKTYQEYRVMKQTPETMAHIFFAHKSICMGISDYHRYDTILECAKQWARYFYKPNKYKRHKMPLWEYLRYTV